MKTLPESVTTLDLSGNELHKNTAEELKTIFDSIPPSVTTVNFNIDLKNTTEKALSELLEVSGIKAKIQYNNYVEFDNKKYTVDAHNLAHEIYVKTKEGAIDFETNQLDEKYINDEEAFNSLMKSLNYIADKQLIANLAICSLLFINVRSGYGVNSFIPESLDENELVNRYNNIINRLNILFDNNALNIKPLITNIVRLMNDDFNDFLKSQYEIGILAPIKIMIEELVNTVTAGSSFAFAKSTVQPLSKEQIEVLKNEEIAQANPPITTAFSASSSSSAYGFDNKGTKINSGKAPKNR